MHFTKPPHRNLEGPVTDKGATRGHKNPTPAWFGCPNKPCKHTCTPGPINCQNTRITPERTWSADPRRKDGEIPADVPVVHHTDDKSPQCVDVATNPVRFSGK